MEQTIKCRICGKPYVFYSHYAGDQSACPACRSAARPKTRPTNTTNWPAEATATPPEFPFNNDRHVYGDRGPLMDERLAQ